MATLGINIYVCLGVGTASTIIAGTRSNEIQTVVDTIEISSPTSGLWKKHKNIRKGWSISTSFLCLANADVQKLLQVGNTYTIQVVGQEGSAAEELLSGTAILTSCKITASVLNLCQGSFVFDGNGELTSDQPVPPTPQNPEIAWSAASATATIGQSNTFPTLSNPHSLPITYLSSDTSVATVDSSGVVTLVSAGSANISASFAGNEDYYASTVSYSLAVEAAYYAQYLTLEALEEGTFTLYVPAIGTQRVTSISYSLDDGQSWTDVTGGSVEINITTPLLQAGSKVLWKGINKTFNYSSSYAYFTSTCQYVVYGNIMSLLYGDSFIDKTSLNTSYTNTFAKLFDGNTNLVDINNLIMPATTLTNGCYSDMFKGCTNITKSPVLPAETLTSYAYSGMFNGCSSLNQITCLAVTTASRSTYQWVSGVSTTGSFYKNTNKTDWASGISGIPTGWTIIDTVSGN